MQHKFYLGTDQRQAERRNQELEELWERIEVFWKELGRAAAGVDRPTWDNLTLEIGKGLAKGESEFRVQHHYESPADYARKIHARNKRYPMIRFVPEDFTLYQNGAEFMQGLVDNEIADVLQAADRWGILPDRSVAPGGTGTLHQAFDDFIDRYPATRSMPITFGVAHLGRISCDHRSRRCPSAVHCHCTP